MELYIRIKDGQPFEHPIFGDNFRQAFPEVDVNNLPPEFARFERIASPILDVYEVMVSYEPTYELIDGVYKDVWHKRDMTAEEKTAKQQEVIATFRSRDQAENWSAWTLDEATCSMIPPIPRPARVEGMLFLWCGADNNWKEAPNCPVDENQYKFDFFAWQWIQVVN
jgi:hypothetical protein